MTRRLHAARCEEVLLQKPLRKLGGRSIGRVAGAAGVILLACQPAVRASGSHNQHAVAYQINAAHSGRMSLPYGMKLVPPLVLEWSRNLGGPVSYPLIADGLVFVTVGNTGSYGTEFYALKLSTGDIVYQKPISGTYYWSNAAYDHKRVFVVNFDGELQAFAAATGDPAWSVQLPGQWAFSSPPTARGGQVFVGGAGDGGTLYAVDEASGNVNWSALVLNGDNSSPALGDQGVYVSYPCQAYKFNPSSGTLLWNYNGGCEGGGGKTPVYHQDRLYVRDLDGGSNAILDAASGAELEGFGAVPAPAFLGNYGFFLANGTLYGIALDTGNALWSFAGDGELTTAPIVFGKAVFVGSGRGRLYMLDRRTGGIEWMTNVGAPIPAPDEQNASQPLTGLGAGEGRLIVPAGSSISAYVPSGLSP